MLAWLYDIRLEGPYLSFVLFRAWTVYRTSPSDIESVREIRPFSLGAWNAYNFKNRLFAPVFLVTLRHGWFTRRVTVTPADASAFRNWCAAHTVSLSQQPQ